jgi:hypothetical protein
MKPKAQRQTRSLKNRALAGSEKDPEILPRCGIFPARFCP